MAVITVSLVNIIDQILTTVWVMTAIAASAAGDKTCTLVIGADWMIRGSGTVAIGTINSGAGLALIDQTLVAQVMTGGTVNGLAAAVKVAVMAAVDIYLVAVAVKAAFTVIEGG